MNESSKGLMNIAVNFISRGYMINQLIQMSSRIVY